MNYQDLSIKLIQEQYKLKNSKSKSILVIIGGIELTRKNQSIKKLSELMDPRYLNLFLICTGGSFRCLSIN